MLPTRLLICVLFFSIGRPLFSQEITFNRNIAPIVYRHCTNCHRSGQAVPFYLETYRDFSSKQKMIRYVIEKQIMPPWKSDSSYRHFANERLMGKSDIKTILNWMDSGMKEGKASDKPPVPNFSNNSGLGKSDFQLKFKNAFPIKGNNKQVFTWIKIPYEFDTDSEFVYVKSVEFVPDNKKLVHHMEIDFFSLSDEANLTETPDTITLNSKGPHYLSVFVPQASEMNIRHLFRESWAPGVSPQYFGDDVGIKLPRKGLVVVNMHYSASPLNDSDNSYFNLYFQKNRALRNVRYFNIGSHSTTVRPKFIIPPDSVKSFYSKIKISEDLSLLYISPHMHLLGKSFLSYAVTPSADTIPLIKINAWDYDWQEFYRFDPVVKIPEGSVIYIRGVFDNTSSNPRNPYNPPRKVDSEGKNAMETNEEMLNLFVISMPYIQGDEFRKWDLPEAKNKK